MRKSQHTKLRLSLLFFLAIAISVTLSACIPLASDYAASYLDEYGIPDFDKAKLREVERVYMNYYVEDLAPPKETALAVANIYFENYHEIIDTGNPDAVTEAVIRSYVKSIGDKYSVYRSAEEYAGYDTEMSGTYFEIGVLLTCTNGNIVTVREVYDAGAAKTAGIRVGDVIVAVDGTDISEIGYEKAIELIRTKESKTVEVSVERSGTRIDFTVEKRKSVTYSIDENKIGFIKISSFKENTDELFYEAVDALVSQGAVGIIYDLRDNRGGYLSAVINALSYIAPDGTTIVSYSNGYGKPRKDNHSHELSIPAVILCNERTASAGELFTAAMRDFDEELGYIDVTLVGEQTFGKGIMQTTRKLSDKSTITLTVAYYNPPSGVNYHGEGIIPNKIVPSGEESDEQLQVAYTEIEKLIN